MPGLRKTTFFSAIFFFATGAIASFYPSHYILSAITFTIATYFYLFSFVYYNALLSDVAVAEKHGIASGWGQFGNWLGQIVGLIIVMPFVNGSIVLWGATGRAQAFIPATLLFLLFALPMLVFFKEKGKREIVPISYKNEYKNVFRSFINMCKAPGLGRFFLAYFFFNDAVITASNNFPIYLDKVFGVNDDIKSYLLVGILIASAISAPLSGWLADRVGLKKVLLGILVGWIVIFPLMAISTNFVLFTIISLIMGLWFGAIWTVTRAVVTQLTPPAILNQSFTYYTLMERFATFIGPISWGVIVLLGPKTNNLNYKFALCAMALFVLVGLILVKKIPSKNPQVQVAN
jgi:UMF1 family MFS transporter